MLTGEPIAPLKRKGDPLTGGTINGAGHLELRLTAVGAQTTLAQIIDLVQQAQGARLPIQTLVNKITLWFVPAVLALAALTLVLWLSVGGLPMLDLAIVAAVSVLIIACPCAMGLATPTSIMVGTGRAAARGILFRKGDALQSLSRVQIIAFDKTGTLTQGHPVLSDYRVATDQDADALLRWIAGAETASEHPLAKAIVQAARDQGLDLPQPDTFQAILGDGATARVEGHDLLIGTQRFLQEHALALDPALAAQADDWAQEGLSLVHVACDGVHVAVLGLSDPIKPSTPAALSDLRVRGQRIVMITGDTEAAAQNIAKRLGIDDVIAHVRPDGKKAAIDMLRRTGRVGFVGDGINDAPALAAADVGIALGTGTDVAIESADVVLMSGDLTSVAEALEISSHTLRNIRQNLVWAFGYNVLLIPVAAGVLYPLYGILLSPMLAAVAMALSSVFVVTNALRLRYAGGRS
jgi:Cu+-exporting ATPase